MSTSRSGRRLQNASLHPPPLVSSDDDLDGAAGIPWVLLEYRAYVAERHNGTTAFSTTWDEKKIQVTFCLARPPQVSYICVCLPGLDHEEFPLEPSILAAEKDLVLLRVIVSSKVNIEEDIDYFIYQAAGSGAGEPSLTRLPRPPSPYFLDSTQAGILRCGTNHDDQTRFMLRPHRDTTDDFYVVAGLCTRSPGADPGQFVLCLYNSKLPAHWSAPNVSLKKQDRLQNGGSWFLHINSKVISIGGDAGTMGFVDLWRGILFCDVLKVEQGKSNPPLRYVQLPSQVLLPRSDDARFSRDIAVVQQGRMIKFLQLQTHWNDSKIFRGHYVTDGWLSRTWSRAVSASYLEDHWHLNCTRESSDIPVKNNPHFELLPKAIDDAGMPLPPFKGLDIYLPSLSLQDDEDGTVCLTTKKNLEDPKAWVIAVDMENNMLQQVTEFAAERTVRLRFAYLHSRISIYLTGAPGTKANLKRPGMALLGPTIKKHIGMSMPPWVDRKQHDAASQKERKKHDTEVAAGDDMEWE